MFNIFFFGNHAVYDILWKNIVVPDRTQMNIWRMLIACWIREVTDTHNIHYTLLFLCNSGCTNAFLSYVYKYIACLINFVYI